MASLPAKEGQQRPGQLRVYSDGQDGAEPCNTDICTLKFAEVKIEAAKYAIVVPEHLRDVPRA